MTHDAGEGPPDEKASKARAKDILARPPGKEPDKAEDMDLDDPKHWKGDNE